MAPWIWLAALALEAAPAEEAPWYAPFGLEVGLETVVGIGTFVSGRGADDPYWASSLVLSPSWMLGGGFRAGLDLGVSYEWTYLVTPCHPASGPRPAGAPAQDCSDTGDPNARRGDLDDLTLSVDHAGLALFDLVDLSPSLSVALPTSRASRAAQNVFTWTFGAGVSKQLGPVTPRVGASWAKYFPLRAAPTLDPGPTSAGHCPSFRSTDCLLLAGFVPSWRLDLSLELATEIPGVEGLSARIAFGYQYTRKHGAGPDAFSSRAVDAAGERVVDGRNSLDTTSGTIEIGYALPEHWSFSFGVASVQPALTADGRSVRFPFFDFISPANNYSGWYLGVQYAL